MPGTTLWASLKCKNQSWTSPLALSRHMQRCEKNRYWHRGRTKSPTRKGNTSRTVSPISCILLLRQRIGRPFSRGFTLGPHKWGLPFYLSLPSCIPRFLSAVFFTASPSLSFRTVMHLWITAWRYTRRESELLLGVLRLKPSPYGRSREGNSKQPAWRNCCLLWPAFPLRQREASWRFPSMQRALGDPVFKVTAVI